MKKIMIIGIMMLLMIAVASAESDNLALRYAFNDNVISENGTYNYAAANGYGWTGSDHYYVEDVPATIAYAVNKSLKINASYNYVTQASPNWQSTHPVRPNVDYSVSFWTKLSDVTGYGGVVASGYQSTPYWDSELKMYGGYFSFRHRDDAGATTTGMRVTAADFNFTNDEWFLVVGTFNEAAQKAELYINNFTATNTGYSTNSANYYRLGHGGPFVNQTTHLADLKFYNKTLSPEEVLEIFEHGEVNPPMPEPVAAQSSSGSTRYVVDGTGNIVGVQSGGTITLLETPEESKAPLLSIGGGETSFDLKTWIGEAWNNIKEAFTK